MESESGFPELQELLARPESVTLEFKREAESPIPIAKILSAFANTSGGWLVLGIADDKSLRGIASEKDTMQVLEAASDHLIEPPLLVRFKAIVEHERTILLVRVDESPEKPHKARNNRGDWVTYVRTKDKSVPAGSAAGKWLRQEQPADYDLVQSYPVRRLLEYLQKNERITARQFAQLVNMSEYRASKLLQLLSRQGTLLQLENQRPKGYVLRKTPI